MRKRKSTNDADNQLESEQCRASFECDFEGSYPQACEYGEQGEKAFATLDQKCFHLVFDHGLSFTTVNKHGDKAKDTGKPVTRREKGTIVPGLSSALIKRHNDKEHKFGGSLEAVLKEVEDGKIKTKEGKMVDVQVKYVNEAMDAAGLQEFLKKCHRNTINQSKRKKGAAAKELPKTYVMAEPSIASRHFKRPHDHEALKDLAQQHDSDPEPSSSSPAGSGGSIGQVANAANAGNHNEHEGESQGRLGMDMSDEWAQEQQALLGFAQRLAQVRDSIQEDYLNQEVKKEMLASLERVIKRAQVLGEDFSKAVKASIIQEIREEVPALFKSLETIGQKIQRAHKESQSYKDNEEMLQSVVTTIKGQKGLRYVLDGVKQGLKAQIIVLDELVQAVDERERKATEAMQSQSYEMNDFIMESSNAYERGDKTLRDICMCVGAHDVAPTFQWLKRDDYPAMIDMLLPSDKAMYVEKLETLRKLVNEAIDAASTTLQGDLDKPLNTMDTEAVKKRLDAHMMPAPKVKKYTSVEDFDERGAKASP
ncbi:hypothetical protein WJX79_004457 [Trebouxia sp. C0005]